jgi:hypothetical protein
MIAGALNIHPAAAQPMSHVIESSLCEIAKHKSKFSGKTVSIEGVVIKIEDYNKIYTTDDRCRDVEFAMRFNAPAGSDGGFDMLYDYLYYSKSKDAFGKVIHCRCVGRVGYIRQKLMGYMVSSPTIYVEKVEKVWLSN